MNPFSLLGKTILVTGASGGIGAQCAIDCSKMGAKVILLARNKERLQQTLSLCEGDGHRYYCVDLTDFKTLPEKVQNMITECGPLSGILHCAGISNTMPLKIATAELMDTFFKANVIGAMMLTKECCKVKRFVKEGGSIVFFSSVMGCVGESAKSLYSMTKGALISASRSLACEFAAKKIRVNCVSPGIVQTPINMNQPYMQDPELRAQFEAKHLLGFGETTDISNACIYLLSDASRWVTGQNLIIDGGFTVR